MKRIVDVQWRLTVGSGFEIEADSQEEAVAEAKRRAQTEKGLQELADGAWDQIRDFGVLGLVDEFSETVCYEAYEDNDPGPEVE